MNNFGSLPTGSLFMYAGNTYLKMSPTNGLRLSYPGPVVALEIHDFSGLETVTDSQLRFCLP